MLIPWLERVCLPFRESGPFTSFRREELQTVLNGTSYADAQLVYRDLSRIQLGGGEEELAVLGSCVAARAASRLRFRACLLENGVLVDLLMDRIQLSRELRNEKWERERSERLHAAQAQRMEAEATRERSAFRLRARDEDAASFASVVGSLLLKKKKKRPTGGKRKDEEEWEDLLTSDDAALCGRPPTFWSRIRTGSLTLVQKRAVAHRLRSCVRHSPPAVLPLLHRLEEELFEAQRTQEGSEASRSTTVRGRVGRLVAAVTRGCGRSLPQGWGGGGEEGAAPIRTWARKGTPKEGDRAWSSRRPAASAVGKEVCVAS